MLVVQVTDAGKEAAEARGQSGRQAQRFKPRFFDLDSGFAVFDHDRHGQPGGELVVDIGAHVDFGFAERQALGNRSCLAAEREALDRVVVRVVAVVPRLALEDDADRGIEGGIAVPAARDAGDTAGAAGAAAASSCATRVFAWRAFCSATARRCSRLEMRASYSARSSSSSVRSEVISASAALRLPAPSAVPMRASIQGMLRRKSMRIASSPDQTDGRAAGGLRLRRQLRVIRRYAEGLAGGKGRLPLPAEWMPGWRIAGRPGRNRR